MYDPETKIAALDERVSNMGSQIVALDRSTRDNFSQLNLKFDSVMRDFAAGQKTQWPSIWAAMGVCVAVLGLVGGMAYAPITTSLTEIKVSSIEFHREVAAAIADLRKTSVTKDDIDTRAARAAEDRDSVKNDIGSLRGQIVPRPEYDVRLHGIDHDRDDLQRQIDQIRTSLGDTYSLRDVIRDQQARIDRLEAVRRQP